MILIVLYGIQWGSLMAESIGYDVMQLVFDCAHANRVAHEAQDFKGLIALAVHEVCA